MVLLKTRILGGASFEEQENNNGKARPISNQKAADLFTKGN
jgi:hypothetical protein